MKHLFIIAMLLATCSGPSLLAADAFPEFKIGSCRQAEETGSVSRDAQACFRDEQNAKDTLLGRLTIQVKRTIVNSC
jgi:hypothetical protein